MGQMARFQSLADVYIFSSPLCCDSSGSHTATASCIVNTGVKCLEYQMTSFLSSAEIENMWSLIPTPYMRGVVLMHRVGSFA